MRKQKTFTKEQINALKYFILNSKDAGEETKKACFALINISKRLTRPVYFTGFSEDITSGIEGMCSSGSITHLNELMKLLGTKFSFSHHDGYYSRGKFLVKICPGQKHIHTIWLSIERYDKESIRVPESRVNKVVLTDPLYPSIIR